MKLGVNIDHVATLRQARKTYYPDPVQAAILAQQNGADQITFHLREDRRHIQDFDLPKLKEAIHIPLNMEMAATEAMTAIVLEFKPYSVTLVPEKREELTTEGGLNLTVNLHVYEQLIPLLKQQGIKVSLFIDPDLTTTKLSQELGADHVEFHTGTYCDSQGHQQKQEWQRLVNASRYAASLGLYVAAGHGIHYQNIQELLKISEIVEYNIGHSIVAESVFIGFGEAVKKMKKILS